MSQPSKFLLTDSQIPTVWVNVLPALPEPLDPPLNPQTRAPLGPQDLLPIFPMELIEQEFSPKPEIDIPGEVMDIYRLWRATGGKCPLPRPECRFPAWARTPVRSVPSERSEAGPVGRAARGFAD